MATQEFFLGQGFHQPLPPAHGKDDVLASVVDELRSLMRQEEINSLTGGEKKIWESFRKKTSSITDEFRKVDKLCEQFREVDDMDNASNALLTNMALEVSLAQTFDEMKVFTVNKGMPAVKEYLDSAVQIQKLAISMPVGPLSIAEFLRNGGDEEMVKKSLGMLVDAQVNGDSPQDLSYEGLMIFDAQKIVRAGILATQSERFLTGTNVRIPWSVEITETMQRFVDNIGKTQENTRAALLNSDEEEVKKEFARLFDCENASAMVCCALGFRDGRETMLFIKQMQKLAKVGSSKDLAFYTTLSGYLLEQVRKYDSSAVVALEAIYDGSAATEPELFGPKIKEADFEEPINILLDSPVFIKQVISPQETHGLLNPDDVAIELSDKDAVIDLVWDTAQGGNKVRIRLDRKEHTIDWSILNDIDSPEVSQKREILLSYVLKTFNLTADSVCPKKQEEKQQVVAPQRAEDVIAKHERAGSEKETIRPKVKPDCPIQIDSKKVEELIRANNIKATHRKTVLAALEDLNAGKGRMLRRVDDKTFKLHAGKVAVSLQEEDGILSIVEISYSK